MPTIELHSMATCAVNYECLAKLIVESDLPFYHKIDGSKEAIVQAIAASICDDRSDFHHLHLLLTQTEVLGLVAFIPAKELNTRKLFTLRHLANTSKSLANQMKEFRELVPALPKVLDESLYLTRLAIVENHRGKGQSVK